MRDDAEQGPQWELSADDGAWYLPPGDDAVLSVTTDDQRVFTLWRADGEAWLEVSEHVGIEAALRAATPLWRDHQEGYAG